MLQHNASVVPLLQRVFHPSDFSEAGNTAFAHALVAALMARAKLTILHASDRRNEHWIGFPGVRTTLERWDMLPENSERAAVAQLGIEVQKVHMIHDDPVESIMTYLEEQGTDLMVIATDQHKSGGLWLNKSVAISVARRSREMTLFIPKGIEGFVSQETGAISLKNIVIPMAVVPSAQPAVQATARLISGFHCDSGTVTLLHVGEQDNTMPQVDCPELAGWQWDRMTRSGDVVEVVTQVMRDTDADLIVMTTDGGNGLLDALNGSLSERVLQEACCPLLTIPANAFITTVL